MQRWFNTQFGIGPQDIAAQCLPQIHQAITAFAIDQNPVAILDQEKVMTKFPLRRQQGRPQGASGLQLGHIVGYQPLQKRNPVGPGQRDDAPARQFGKICHNALSLTRNSSFTQVSMTGSVGKRWQGGYRVLPIPDPAFGPALGKAR